jgi:hypothetical protein
MTMVPVTGAAGYVATSVLPAFRERFDVRPSVTHRWSGTGVKTGS